MTLGARIAELRKAAGLSQEALAAKLGVSRQAIGKWEADASLPGLDNLHLLAKELGVSIDSLLTGQAAEDTAAPETPLSLEGIQTLLDGQAHNERRRQLHGMLALGLPLGLAVLALAAGVLWQGRQLAGLQDRLQILQGNVATADGTLVALQNRLDSLSLPQTAPTESLVASWDVQTKEYSPAERKALLALTATPRTITEDCTARFTLTLSDGQSLSLEARRGEGDAFFAEGWVPLAESYTLNVSFTAGGETRVEQLYTEPLFAGQYEMQILDLPFVAQSASYMSFSKTFTVQQNAGDYEIPVAVNFSEQGRPLHWPVKAWVTATLDGEQVLDLPLDTSFIQPDAENYPSDPSRQVTFYLRFSLEEESFKLPWKEEYEAGPRPEIDYQLHILDNAGAERSYSMN